MRRSGPSLDAGMRDEFLAWQSGDYAYTWQGNGMLRSVTRPDGKTVTFKYDALGRRIEKVFDGRVYRYLWDGDVILHEWDYAESDRPNTVVTEIGEVTLDRPEPVENLITWVYDSDSYVPTAKIVGDRHYSIISDYIGRLSRYTMIKVMSSGRQTMTSMVISATLTAAGSSFLSAS